MSFLLARLALAAVTLLVLASQASAHSRLLSPRPRWGGYCSSGWNGSSDECAPCGPNGKAGANPSSLVYQRGQVVPLTWPRNNHAAGFIGISVVPFDAPQETHDEFVRNPVSFSCFESGCRSGYQGNPLGGDGPGVPEDGNVCSSSFKVPTWLPDGRYTGQWRWFGGGSWFGQLNRGVGDFVNCFDFTVSGGAAVAARDTCPAFIPGDAHVPRNANKCLHFGAAEPRKCKPDGCRGEYKQGVPAVLQSCLAASSTVVSSSSSSSTAAATTTESAGSVAAIATTSASTATLTQQPSSTSSTASATTSASHPHKPSPTKTTIYRTRTSVVTRTIPQGPNKTPRTVTKTITQVTKVVRN